MSTTTKNLGLFKYDTITDANVPFSINQALNDNWDILDEKYNDISGVTTIVDGTTWYRLWKDGWKEQGGEVSLAETERVWEQPTLTENGTLGQGEFAVQANQEYTASSKLYCAFDKNASTNAATTSIPATWTMYFGIPVNISNINFLIWSNGAPKTGYFEVSNNGTTWTNVGNISNTIGTGYVNLPINTSGYYKYWRMVVTQCTTAYLYCTEITITATYKTSVANSIIFPVAFQNSNYSYTFANQDGGGMDAYVSNKTISGMTLTNTNSGRASWTACGY